MSDSRIIEECAERALAVAQFQPLGISELTSTTATFSYQRHFVIAEAGVREGMRYAAERAAEEASEMRRIAGRDQILAPMHETAQAFEELAAELRALAGPEEQ